jgi:ABC-type Fe3+-hydroxamate transport system substrate-binding protein
MGRVRLAFGGAAALLFLLGATGCGLRSEPTGTNVPLYPVTVHGSSDAATTLTKRPARIVALAAAPAAILDAIGAGDRVVGRPGALTGGGGEILAPAVVARRPDLIVASPEEDPAVLERLSQKTGAPVYVTPDGSVHDVEQSFTDLGLLTGEPLGGRRLVEETKAKLARIHDAVAGRQVTTTFFDAGFFTTVSSQSLVGDMIRRAGGQSVAGASPGNGPFDLGQLAALDPDFFLTSSDTGTTLSSLRKNPKARKLRAVTLGQFGVVDAAALEPGPHVADGVVAIARLLHPDAVR